MGKRYNLLSVLLAVVFLAAVLSSTGCSKKSTQSGQTAGGNETAVTETPVPEAEPAAADAGDNSGEGNTAGDTDGQTANAMTPEEEENVFQELIASIPLKAKETVTYDFDNVSVHDPSIVKAEDMFYIFGSHLAAAKSTDLINWTQIANGVTEKNKLIPDARTEMKEAFDWARTNTFWAPDVVQLEDGRYYMYYCNCEGSSPLSALGIAVSDDIEGPYRDLGIILKSGMSGAGEDGDTYNAVYDPNVVDPCVFYDKDNRLWMMYGSYSGGIFILELDKKTGFPLESGYGKKILGENHLRIEASFIQYSKETDYYYMFLSFGGLTADGGYNIRVARSKTPDGPYYDSMGQDMINCKGPAGTFFNDKAAEPYGAKIMGNFHWNYVEGEVEGQRTGYVSPGHNSTYYEEETGRYFLIFHTRFENRGEVHQVRVHQMFLNEDGWFVAAPYRYVGETISTYTEGEVAGAYKVINHGHDISKELKQSENLVLMEDHRVIGALHGTWELKNDNTCILTVDEKTYKGVFLKQWDENGLKNVMTFSVLSEEGIAIWGSGYRAME